MTKLTASFYGNMKWFEVDEQPEGFHQLPPAFLEAKQLWDKEGTHREKIIELLSPYVKACFTPEYINNDADIQQNIRQLFTTPDQGVIAKTVHVVGIDFSYGFIPECKAEAYFDVPVKEAFWSTDLENWREENGLFCDGLVFYWDIPLQKGMEDFDVYCVVHAGAEGYFLLG